MKIKYITKTISIVLILLVRISLIAQPINNQIGDVILPSADAIAFGKFAEIPISQFNGTTAIGLPLYTINQGPLSHSVTMNYNTSGVKVAEPASWVGLGWTLNASAMVSRSVVGIPDEGFNGWFSRNNVEDIQPRSVGLGQVDTEPDVFNFSIGGYSGKFIFPIGSDSNEEIEAFLIPKQDVSITRTFTGSSFNGIKIITPNGVNYHFGIGPNGSYVQTTETVNSGQENVTGWYLAKIESHDQKHQILFDYEEEHYTYRYPSSQEYLSTNQLSNCGNESNVSTRYLGPDINSPFHLNSVKGWRLQEISNSSETVAVDFVASIEDREDLTRMASHPPKSLNSIEIHNGLYGKKFELGYTYWQSPGNNNAAWYKRLRLESIHEKPINDVSTTTTSPYEFKYEGNINSLPHRLSRSIDHWGYYNGEANSGTSVNIPPTIIGGISYGYSDRNSNETFMLKGILNKVIYPTSGYTEYIYGANRYLYPVNETSVLIRIDRVTSFGCDINVKIGQEFDLSDEDISYGKIRVQLFDLIDLDPSCSFATVRSTGITLLDKDDKVVGNTSIGLDTDEMNSDNSYNLKSLFPDLILAGKYKIRLDSRNVGATVTISGPDSGEQDVGGLRIEAIHTYDSDGTLKNQTDYDYTVSEHSSESSGKLYNQPVYGSHLIEPGFNLVSFRDISVTSLAGFDGYHIGYTRVKKIKPNNGFTVYENTVETRVPNNSFPVLPDLYLAQNGKNDKTSVFRENQSLAINSTDKNYLGPSYENLPTSPFKVFYSSHMSGSGQTCEFIRKSTYNIRSGYNLIESKAETLDGLTTTKSYTYNTSDQLFPTSESVVNSDGKTHTTTYDYPSTIGLTYRSTLLDQNRIIPAWKTQSTVDGVVADGLRTNFRFYDNAGNIAAVQSQTPLLYPAVVDRYQATTNTNLGSLLGGSWVTQQTISKYHIGGSIDLGLPKEVSIAGWSDPIEYQWAASGKLTNWKFIDFEKNYIYHPQSTLLSSFTDIDGLIQTFDYDDLMRPNEVIQNQGSYSPIITTTDYTYGATNKVNVITDYGSSYEIETETILDGLGREVEIIQKNHDNSETGDVKTTIVYDNVGRRESVKDARNLTTTTTYYPSPLNRIHTISNDAYLGSNTFDYSSGNPSISSITDLYITTQTDQDGRVAQNYIDKIGRNLVNSVGRPGNLEHTVTEYDDKNRVWQIHPPDAYQIADLIYKYTYDDEDKILIKKIPEKGIMRYSYDNRDLQIGWTDSNIWTSGERWLNTEYDRYGRPIKTGYGVNVGVVTKELTQQFYDNVDAHNTIDSANPIYTGKMHKKIINILNGFSQGTNNLTTTYTYDDGARMVSENLLTNHMGGNSIADYTYDDAHNLLTSRKMVNNIPINTTYIYDDEGRLRRTFFNANGSSSALITNITEYSDSDEVLSKTVGSMETCNYEYNSLGWLTGINPINTPSGAGQILNCPGISNTALQSRLFSMELSYSTGVTPEYSGNISEQNWKMPGRALQSINYKYDHLNRITHSTSKDHLFDTYYSYKDGRGNIDKITRFGLGANGACYTGGMVDNMTINYKGNGTSNQINSITESGDCPHYYYLTGQVNQSGTWAADIELNSDALIQNNISTTLQAGETLTLNEGFSTAINQPGTFLAQIAECATVNSNLAEGVGYLSGEGFVAGSGTYTYDDNGNITNDPSKGFTFKYNHLNLPFEATKNASNKIEWLYTAEGEKLRKSVTIGGVVNSVKKDYLVEAEFDNSVLDAVYHDEGRLAMINGVKEQQYFLKDHLGNTRVVFRQAGSNKEILQESHYYPFGMEMNGPWVSKPNTENDYLYNGKELNKDLGLNLSNYGARFYDPSIGRFTGVDPISDQFSHVTTYNYAENSPIVNIDLHGMQKFGMQTGIQNVRNHIKKTQTPKDLDDLDSEIERNASIARIAAKIMGGALGGSGAIVRFGAARVGTFLFQEAVETGFEAASGIPVLLDPVDLMQKGLKKTGKTVLGHVEDNYQDLATDLEASVFHFEDEVWEKLVEQGVDMGKLNIDFLDEVIKNGDTVILTRANKDIGVGRALRKEVDYLLSKKYKWADDSQTKLIPK